MDALTARPIRRSVKEIARDKIEEILRLGEFGTLATAVPDEWPYAVPLSYVWVDGCIYFHCAMEGHKLDNLAENPRCCFSVAQGVQAVYDYDFSTYYQSVTAFGTASRVADESEKAEILRLLCEKYLPDHMDQFEKHAAAIPRTCVMKITVTHLTGKAKEKP